MSSSSDPLADPATSDVLHAGPSEERPAPQRVPVNVWETHRALVVVAPMPGVTPDEVSVTLRGRHLRLAADLRTPAEKDYRLQEWFYGAYERVLDIGEGFGAPVTATLGNGLLAVSVARQRDEATTEREEVEVTPTAAGSGPLDDERPT
jgi:HSP20 family molecular chaperone IbpA